MCAPCDSTVLSRNSSTFAKFQLIINEIEWHGFLYESHPGYLSLWKSSWVLIRLSAYRCWLSFSGRLIRSSRTPSYLRDQLEHPTSGMGLFRYVSSLYTIIQINFNMKMSFQLSCCHPFFRGFRTKRRQNQRAQSAVVFVLKIFHKEGNSYNVPALTEIHRRLIQCSHTRTLVRCRLSDS